jgi:hypothetical protein
LYERVHWYIVVFDGNKPQCMILIHNRMHSIKIIKWLVWIYAVQSKRIETNYATCFHTCRREVCSEGCKSGTQLCGFLLRKLVHALDYVLLAVVCVRCSVNILKLLPYSAFEFLF